MITSKLVIGNLKMNLETVTARDEYLNAAKKEFAALSQQQQKSLAICPPELYIESFVHAMDKIAVSVGGQNAHSKLRGSYTGEVSPKMLASIGANCVILGHSERRKAGESIEMVIEKISTALFVHLTPIICVGYCKEGEDEQRAVKDDVMRIASALSTQQLANVILAYEPVWAIGTGKVPSAQHIHTMSLHIKKAIALASGAAQKIPVLYGGSVTTENVREIYKDGHVDGVLVGGASLEPANLARMVKLIHDM